MWKKNNHEMEKKNGMKIRKRINWRIKWRLRKSEDKVRRIRSKKNCDLRSKIL
jgi:hypothetical protein